MRGAWLTVTSLTVAVYVFGWHPPVWLAVAAMIVLAFLSRSPRSSARPDRASALQLPPLGRLARPDEASAFVQRVRASMAESETVDDAQHEVYGRE